MVCIIKEDWLNNDAINYWETFFVKLKHSIIMLSSSSLWKCSKGCFLHNRKLIIVSLGLLSIIFILFINAALKTNTIPITKDSYDASYTDYDGDLRVDLNNCPPISPNLVGQHSIETEELSFPELEDMFPNLRKGGRFKPVHCTSNHKVAIIVPYRDRENHLRVFLRNLHPLLQKQQLDYGIYVTEQAGNETFNRGLIKNIGLSVALKDYDYNCVIFHDVDLIPENDKNPYNCFNSPRHLSRAVSTFKYKLPPSLKNLFGGVVVLTREQITNANGYSNLYWGWGAEDNDLFERLRILKLKVVRLSNDISRYKMLQHKKDSPNPIRYQILKYVKKRWKLDGLSNIENYFDEIKISKNKLFTRVVVNIFEPQPDYAST